MATTLGRVEKLNLTGYHCAYLRVGCAFPGGTEVMEELMSQTASHDWRGEDEHPHRTASFGTRYRNQGRYVGVSLDIMHSRDDTDARISLRYSPRLTAPVPAHYLSVNYGLDFLDRLEVGGKCEVKAIFDTFGDEDQYMTAVQTPVRIAWDPRADFTHIDGIQLAKHGSEGLIHRVAISRHDGHLDGDVDLVRDYAWNRGLPLMAFRAVVDALGLAAKPIEE